MTPAEERILIEHMLSDVEQDFDERGKVNRYVKSLREQFDERGTLSPNQMSKLREMYEDV